MDAIRADAIVKDFGSVRALDEVTIGIRSGELFFLLGGSGCGKTTLLRCIAGLEEPASGTVFFDGEDVTGRPTHKREAAMVFQSYALWPHMTVKQNVAFGLEERKLPRAEIDQRVGEVLEMVQLSGYEQRAIDQLSGGQQQRVSLARALVVRPKCLLLDEPLSNLDARLRLEMRTEIRRIVKENGLTGVYVTHDQSEALSMADRMAVMDGGRVEQIGTPEEIYREPRTSYVAAFIGETNLLEGTVREVPSGSAHVMVSTAAGDLTGRLTREDWSPREGASVMVSIRPEAIQLSEAGGRIPGEVAETTYLGNVIQYRIRTAGGMVLQVAEMNPRVVRQPGGQGVFLDVQAEDVVVLQE